MREARAAKLARPSVADMLKPKPKRKGRKRASKSRLAAPASRNSLRLSKLAEDFLWRSEYLPTNFQVKPLNGTPPYDTPINKFKRLAYKLIRNTVTSTGGYKTIQNIHDCKNIVHKGPDYEENPFFWGLLAIDSKRKKLSRHQLGVMSRQMLYAHRNDVPPCLFVGFIYQIGKRSEITSKIAQDDREPWDIDDRILKFESPNPWEIENT